MDYMGSAMDEVERVSEVPDDISAGRDKVLVAESVLMDSREDDLDQVDLSVRIDNSATLREISSNTASDMETEEPELDDALNTVRQNEIIIPDQPQSSSQLNVTNANGSVESIDDTNINLPDEIQDLQVSNNTEYRFRDPRHISIFPSLNIEDSPEIFAAESNHQIHDHNNNNNNNEGTATREHPETSDNVCDDTASPPPDYNEYIVLEYYKNHGLICSSSQTLSWEDSETGTRNPCDINQTVNNGNGSQHISFSPVDSLQPTAPSNLDFPDTIQRTDGNVTSQSGADQSDKRLRRYSVFFIIVLIIAGVLFGIVVTFAVQMRK